MEDETAPATEKSPQKPKSKNEHITMRRYVRFSHTLYGSYLNSVCWLILFYA